MLCICLSLAHCIKPENSKEKLSVCSSSFCIWFHRKGQNILTLVSLCLMWDQIFSIGFKSGLWTGQNMSLIGLFSSHILVVFAVWAGALSCWKITSDCSAFENNFSIVGSKPFCNIILYSKALIDFSQWSSSPVPAAEKAPHTMTPLPPCLTVVEMHSLLYFSPDLQTHLSGGQHATEILIHHSTQLCWTTLNKTCHILPKTSFCLMFFWDSNGFLTYLLDRKTCIR